jgi:hypothetical protein
MTQKTKDVVKGVVKRPAPKSTFGTDPNDPWSVKSNVAEGITSGRKDVLARYLKSKGYNPKFITKDQKDAHAKTGDFLKWKQDHSIYEDNFADPQAATQSPFDGANNTNDVAPTKKKNSKCASMVKEIYSNRRAFKESLYDWEKEDKGGKPLGKKPIVQKSNSNDDAGDNKPNSRMTLKGGTTLTGQKRDTLEIDPMLNNRNHMPDYKSTDNKKLKKQ